MVWLDVGVGDLLEGVAEVEGRDEREAEGSLPPSPKSKYFSGMTRGSEQVTGLEGLVKRGGGTGEEGVLMQTPAGRFGFARAVEKSGGAW